MNFQKTIRVDEFYYAGLGLELPAGVSYRRNSGYAQHNDVSVTIFADTELLLGYALGLLVANSMIWDDSKFPMKAVRKDAGNWLTLDPQRIAA
jgi:hypothetical protein